MPPRRTGRLLVHNHDTLGQLNQLKFRLLNAALSAARSLQLLIIRLTCLCTIFVGAIDLLDEKHYPVPNSLYYAQMPDRNANAML